MTQSDKTPARTIVEIPAIEAVERTRRNLESLLEKLRRIQARGSKDGITRADIEVVFRHFALLLDQVAMVANSLSLVLSLDQIIDNTEDTIATMKLAWQEPRGKLLGALEIIAATNWRMDGHDDEEILTQKAAT